MPNDLLSPADINHFWFEEISPQQRFKKDPDFDQQVRDRFLGIHTSILNAEKEAWRRHAEGSLAYIIVLDQFSRNMFRDQPASFASDHQALNATLEGLEKQFDQQLPENQRSFFYMPLMHSEDPAMHEKAVPLFEALDGDWIKFERLHKKIIDRFGRYPHRNEILGRSSTAEEIAFLKEKNSSF